LAESKFLKIKTLITENFRLENLIPLVARMDDSCWVGTGEAARE